MQGGSYLTRLSDKRPDAAIAATVQATIQDAVNLFKPTTFEGEWSKGGLAITSLSPKHVGATNQATGLQGGVAGSAAFGVTALTASTWANWLNLNIDDRAYHVVTGFFNLTPDPKVTMAQPFLNGEDMPIISLEEMYSFQEAKGYFSKPYAVTPANLHRIQLQSAVTIAGVPAERIGLMGYAVGRRAYLIQQ